MQTGNRIDDLVEPSSSGSSSESARAERRFIWFSWAFFAIALAVITRAHELYLDEAQAWLNAERSHGLAALFSRFHYDGHPALWYLLLYGPAHLSPDMVWMKLLNYCFSLILALLILSWRQIRLLDRTLVVFSVFVFFYMGVVARSYALSGVLLVAAARSFSSGKRWHWPAILFLCLAINTHFLAIPLSAAIFIWFYWLQPKFSMEGAVAKLRDRQFWVSVAFLALALFLCYLSVRPAKDLYMPQYERKGLSPLEDLTLAVGAVFHYFIVFPAGLLSSYWKQELSPYSSPSLLAAALTIALLGVALGALPHRAARCFALFSFLLWTLCISFTVHTPTAFHTSFLFITYLVAMGLPSSRLPDQSAGDHQVRAQLIAIGLSVQIVSTVIFSTFEINRPFSGAKPTADWLSSSGLSKRPLIIQSDLVAPALLAYLQTDAAFLPACNCESAVVVFRRDRDETRLVTPAQFAALENRFGASPILITNVPDDPSPGKLGLQLLYTSPSGWFWEIENLRVYGLRTPASVSPR